jgi:hypothetical protein
MSAAVEFLQRLRPNGPWQLHAIMPDGPITTRMANTAEDVNRFVKKHDGQGNLYYTVNPRRTVMNKKPKKEDIAAIENLLSDLDPEANERADDAKVRYLGQLNGDFEPKPSAVVDSGNGIQTLWRLTNPIVLPDDAKERATTIADVEARSAALMLRLGGKAGTQNIDRILRLPGTTNLPTESKRKAGRIPCPTKLLSFNGTSYSLDAFPQAATDGKGAKADGAEDEYEPSAAPLPRELATRLHIKNEGAGKRHADYATRHELLFAFIIEALRKRVSAKDIISACLDDKYHGCAVREHCRDNGDRPYVTRQIKQARAKIQDELDTAVGEINETYAMVLAGDKAAIMMFENNSFRLLQIGGFNLWFANRQVLAGKRVMSKGEYWLNHPQRRQYEGIEFEPSGHGRAGYYNLWRGYSVQPKAGDCSLFLAHLKDNIAQSNQALYDWVVGWFAQIFQHPEVKTGTSLVLRGPTATGKTIVGQIFGSLIKDHYRLVADARYVTGQFNAHMVSLLLLQADEAFWAGDKKAQGKLKDLITGESHPIEYKHVDPIWIKNFVRLLATSNEDFVVPAIFKERRFATLDVGSAHAHDKPYFTAIMKQMNNGGREALLQHLLDFDLSTVNLHEIPKTAALVEQIIEAMSPEQAWWFDTLKSGVLPWGMNEKNKCPARKLFVRYIKHAQLQGARRRSIETKIGMFLVKYVGSGLRSDKANYSIYDKHERVSLTVSGRVYAFPLLKECRERFAEEMGHSIAWGFDEEWQHEPDGIDDDEIPY